MLTVHHLQRSQSERIVWLCEELGIPYELKTYKRDGKTMMSPPELQALHPTKAAPIIQDGKITLGESGAIVEYILTKYGQGKLALSPDADNYADYLYFLHFANGYFQPALMRWAEMKRMKPSPTYRGASLAQRDFDRSLDILEDRLSKNAWLAGDEFTAADIMVVTTLTTMRLFAPYSLAGRDAILAFLKKVSQRDAFKRALEKGDPGMQPLIGAEKPSRGNL